MPTFIVPRRGVSTLVHVDDGGLSEIGPLPMPPLAPHAVDASGLVAFLHDDERSVGLLHLDADWHEQRFDPLPLPDRLTPRCLAFDAGRLLVGGEQGGEMIGLFDLNEPAPAWRTLEVPPQFSRAGKAIDALLIDGDRLIAVDDESAPKYLLLYDRSGPGLPAFRRTHLLATHGAYETVVTAAMNERTIAVLSHSQSGYYGSRSHVAFLDRMSLNEFGALFEASDWRRPAWSDVAWSAGRLLLAAGQNGLGSLTLAALGTPPAGAGVGVRSGSSVGDANDEAAAFSVRCQSALRHFDLGPDPLVRVAAAPAGRFLATFQRGGEFEGRRFFDTELLPLPAAR